MKIDLTGIKRMPLEDFALVFALAKKRGGRVAIAEAVGGHASLETVGAAAYMQGIRDTVEALEESGGLWPPPVLEGL